jgi:hypothetical protein
LPRKGFFGIILINDLKVWHSSYPLPKEAVMDFGSINWLAVAVCFAVNMIIGSIWFSEKGFFPPWWAAIGKSKSEVPGIKGPNAMALTFGITMIAVLVVVVFMSLMVTAMGKMTPGGATLVSGATTGLVLWLGFVGPTSIANRVFAGQLKAWVLEAGYHLVNFVVIGAILGAWR